MESVRDKWTDERLDDLNRRVDGGFREGREESRTLRVEMNERFVEVNERFGRVDSRLDAIDVRLDGIQRSIAQLAVAMTTAIVAGFAGIFALLAAAL
jgi:tetrahydromethanopterin S-methyltransferase subunit G